MLVVSQVLAVLFGLSTLGFARKIWHLIGEYNYLSGEYNYLSNIYNLSNLVNKTFDLCNSTLPSVQDLVKQAVADRDMDGIVKHVSTGSIKPWSLSDTASLLACLMVNDCKKEVEMLLHNPDFVNKLNPLVLEKFVGYLLKDYRMLNIAINNNSNLSNLELCKEGCDVFAVFKQPKIIALMSPDFRDMVLNNFKNCVSVGKQQSDEALVKRAKKETEDFKQLFNSTQYAYKDKEMPDLYHTLLSELGYDEKKDPGCTQLQSQNGNKQEESPIGHITAASTQG